MENKKDIERKCLYKTLAYKNKANKETKSILNQLSGCITEAEEPDFIIKNNEERIGVEHFLIDTLLGRKKAARTRLRQSEINRTFNRYHDNLDGNEEKATGEIQDMIQAEIDAIQNFNYAKFIQEFERIVNEHLSKVERYKSVNKIDSIAFLMEIPIAKNKMIGLTLGESELLQNKIIKGCNFPFTNDMLNVFKKISKKVDYTVVSIMHENYKKCAYLVYAFDNCRFDESFDKQIKIKDLYLKFTYEWQTYHFKTKAQLKFCEDIKE